MAVESPPVSPSPPSGMAPVAPAARTWTVTEGRDATRVVLTDRLGAAELAELTAHLAALPSPRPPLAVDLTGVTELTTEVVDWLGSRHAADGRDHPMIVQVVADERAHLRLIAPGAPPLRLKLV